MPLKRACAADAPNVHNYLIDYHIAYSGVLVYLIVKNAGRVWGLDGWVQRLTFVERRPGLRRIRA